MNISADFLGMLERALQDSYDEGIKHGQRSAGEMQVSGYAQAMLEVASWAQSRLEALKARHAEHDAQQPEPEPEEQREVHLSPAKAKIVDYVRANPGVIAAEIQRACGGSNSAIYDLHKLGLVTKTGRQFYPPAVNP